MGTYELFQHFQAVPIARDVNQREIGTMRAVLGSVLSISLFNGLGWRPAVSEARHLRLDASVFESLDDLRGRGPRPSFEEQGRVMESPDLFGRVTSAAPNALVQMV